MRMILMERFKLLVLSNLMYHSHTIITQVFTEYCTQQTRDRFQVRIRLSTCVTGRRDFEPIHTTIFDHVGARRRDGRGGAIGGPEEDQRVRTTQHDQAGVRNGSSCRGKGFVATRGCRGGGDAGGR